MQHHGAALRAETDQDDELVEALAGDWREAAVPEDLRALLDYAAKLTRKPGAVDEGDVERLRDAGWSDEAILHACEVVAYFNFVNRTADGLGVSLEPDWPHPIVPLGEEEDAATGEGA